MEKGDRHVSNGTLRSVRQRCRILVLLDAAERAAITPLLSARLHALAYLADVLSPVWDLPPIDGKVLKLEDGPHYPDVQAELDYLVVYGLVTIEEMRYVSRLDGGARLEGKYGLDFSSNHLFPILEALGAGEPNAGLDPRDTTSYNYLTELAAAFATVPNENIDRAAKVDATYANDRVATLDLIDFEPPPLQLSEVNRSVAVTQRFEQFVPNAARLLASERLYLYANYLGKQSRR